ncbi:tRNA wybutosine-synthesizing protein 4-like [Ostrea edulis]|uniref:tRNA wybutosine-synthesizing protein 4-like n=1 Tax=Ostrea edulis TaxID=37623 RepID=UPI0024AEDA8B|nr:tRNA wybutosine-synthesizing protein 4-like [Ostrea edulis]
MAASMSQKDGQLCINKTTEKKTKTGKSRRETAVQGTNDSSIVSKCSMASVGYFSDPYLHCFVSKTTRRSPLIHRGYYVRAKAVDFFLKKFLETYPQNNQIVSLGAGFDSTYFRLRSEGVLTNTSFCEVDFPEVVQRKNAVIQSNEDLKNLIPGLKTQGAKKNPLIEINTRNYKLLGVDLTQLNTLEACFNLCGVDWDTPTLLLSECVMTYMTRRCSSAVVKWAGEAFSEAVFILYEQINPNDAFGKFMQNHFQLIGSPLKCINSFPTLHTQRDRFLNLGWSRSEAADMNHFYAELVPPDEQHRVESLEPFDEYEEWHLKCNHYMVVNATNSDSFPSLLPEILTSQDTDIKDCITVEGGTVSNPIWRFGHSSVLLSDGHSLVSFGGFGEELGKHCRILDLTITDIRTLQSYTVPVKVNPREVQVSRMHDQSVLLRDGSVILMGGRISPIHLCNQVLRIEFTPARGSQAESTVITPARGSQAESTVLCTNCGNTTNSVCDHKENVCPEEYVLLEGNHSEVCDSEQKTMNKSRRQEARTPSVCNQSNSSGNNCERPGNNHNGEGNNCERPGDNHNGEGNNCEEEFRRPEVNCVQLNSDSVRPDDINRSADLVEKLSSEGVYKYNSDSDGKVEKKSGKSSTEEDFHGYSGVRIQEVSPSGDVVSPRWRHSAVLIEHHGRDLLFLHGGRTDKKLALDDSYLLDTESFTWTEIEDKSPGKRQSHTASVWRGYVIIAGGMDQELRPLNSVYTFSIQTQQYTEIQMQGNLLPRYSHTAHVISDHLILVGGVNVNHSVPGVAFVDIDNQRATEFEIPIEYGQQLFMLHKHTSSYLGNNRILVIGGGGNCFSFGTHLNYSPLEIDISRCWEKC